jgi:hypothetical protein
MFWLENYPLNGLDKFAECSRLVDFERISVLFNKALYIRSPTSSEFFLFFKSSPLIAHLARSRSSWRTHYCMQSNMQKLSVVLPPLSPTILRLAKRQRIIGLVHATPWSWYTSLSALPQLSRSSPGTAIEPVQIPTRTRLDNCWECCSSQVSSALRLL